MNKEQNFNNSDNVIKRFGYINQNTMKDMIMLMKIQKMKY